MLTQIYYNIHLVNKEILKYTIIYTYIVNTDANILYTLYRNTDINLVTKYTLAVNENTDANIVYCRIYIRHIIGNY